jgi:hypothetical protein
MFMDYLRDVPQDHLDLLDKALVRYEFELKHKLSLSGLSDKERQSVENELSLLFQIYNHLQSSIYKI